MKTLDIFWHVQVALEYIQYIVAQIHIVCLVAMFKFESLTHRSTMYFWWLCSDLSHIGMDPQCMSGGHDLSYLTWIFACRHLCFESFVFWVWECLPQWWYIIVLYFLVCWQVSDRLFLVPYTHSTKYFSYHSILTSYFGGLSVTHYFCHPYDC